MYIARSLPDVMSRNLEKYFMKVVVWNAAQLGIGNNNSTKNFYLLLVFSNFWKMSFCLAEDESLEIRKQLARQNLDMTDSVLKNIPKRSNPLFLVVILIVCSWNTECQFCLDLKWRLTTEKIPQEDTQVYLQMMGNDQKSPGTNSPQ